MTYFKRVIKPTLWNIVLGFVITSALIGLVVLFTTFPYLPQYILLGNLIGSAPGLWIRHREWKADNKRGVEV